HRARAARPPPPKAPRPDWTPGTPGDLVRDLSHPNLTVRMMAMHQLVERGQPAVAAMKRLLKPETPATPRAHALWVLERLKALSDAELDAAAEDKDLTVQVHALRILAERDNLSREQTAIVCQSLLRHPDGLVRRVAADVLARHPKPDIMDALLTARQDPTTGSDPFLLHTVRMALREQLRGQRLVRAP